MAIVEHVELDALRSGTPVVIGTHEVGRVADVIPQPDGRHPVRLIVKRAADDKLVKLPIEWVRGLEDGRLTLEIGEYEFRELPEYIPPLPVEEARRRVQHALDTDERTRGHGITVGTRDGSLELRGHVTDPSVRANASAVSRSIPGVGAVRNLVSTGEGQISAAGYEYPWLHRLIERATGLDLDDALVGQVEDLAERKLVDLFDVAEDAAAANGRSRVQRHDLPVTKGLQLVLLEVADLSREFELQPLLIFLADAGIHTPIDEMLHSEIPRLMAALLIVVCRTASIIEPAVTRPSAATVERAEAVLDLTL
jgi:hypothetical protein